MKETKEAGFLVRCSTDKQDYERQILDLSVVAERFNFHVSESNIFGEYVTGRDDTTKKDRISIIRCREAAEQHKFDYLLVAEVSRMSRDSVSGRVYVRQFCNLGIPIYFRDKMKWTINLETGREDESFIKELGLYFDGAAEYLKSMKTQIASGRRSMLRNNAVVLGHIPIGYKKRGGQDRYRRHELVIDEKTAPIVREIFRLYISEDATLKSVALEITAKYNLRKTVSSIHAILHRKEYYTGKHIIFMSDPDDKEKGKEPFTIEFEPLIDEQTFELANKKLTSNIIIERPHASQKIFMLSRLIKCPFCGHSFSPKRRSGEKPGEMYRCINNKITYSWVCMSRIHNASICLSRINLNNEKLEAIIWNFIKRELIGFADMNKDSREEKILNLKQKIAEAQSNIPLFEQEIEKVEAMVKKAHKAYMAGTLIDEDVALEQYTESLKEAKRIKRDLIAQVESYKKMIRSCEGSIRYYCNSSISPQYLKSIEDNEIEKRKIVTQLIERITPYSIRIGVNVLRLLTVNGQYYILYDGNQVGEKRVAHYIAAPFAVWHTENEGTLEAYEMSSYFTLKNTDIICGTEGLNNEHVTFSELQRVCDANGWILPYNYIYNQK